MPSTPTRNKKWKPKDGKWYWYVDINDGISVENTIYFEHMFTDINRINMGNCFKTQKDAYAVHIKIKQLFKK